MATLRVQPSTHEKKHWNQGHLGWDLLAAQAKHRKQQGQEESSANDSEEKNLTYTATGTLRPASSRPKKASPLAIVL